VLTSIAYGFFRVPNISHSMICTFVHPVKAWKWPFICRLPCSTDRKARAVSE
jgi:hypothetical protein